MFNTENLPILWRIGRRLWRIGRRLYYTHTHTPILEESALELADSSSKSTDSNAYSPRICVWVLATLHLVCTILLSGAHMFMMLIPVHPVSAPYLRAFLYIYIYIGLCTQKKRQVHDSVSLCTRHVHKISA